MKHTPTTKGLFLWPRPRRIEWLGGVKAWPHWSKPAACFCEQGWDPMIYDQIRCLNDKIRGLAKIKLHPVRPKTT
ncbi:MAG: hypothetical protein ABSH19_09500, partial [Opitutales bacterium]